MTTIDGTESVNTGGDARMAELMARRRHALSRSRRGWLVTRMLLLADVFGLSAGFLIAQARYGGQPANDGLAAGWEFAVFFLTLPAWIVAAKLYELYDLDEERADFTTTDELVRVFHLVTVGSWLLFAASWVTGAVDPNIPKLVTFWLVATVLVASGRAAARTFCRRRESYQQNAIIIGAGSIGQLIARKLTQHPEYGIRLMGFIDPDPRPRRAEIVDVPDLGSPSELPVLIRELDVERVIVAFSRTELDDELDVVRRLKQLNVQVDIVPRLFEAVGPNAGIHSLEGLPLLGLPSAKLFPLSRRIKRAVDIVGAGIGLLLASPVFLLAAIAIKRDSEGPVFFRQTRLGLHMREFTILKFRTMKVDTDDSVHREFIRATMSADAAPTTNGLYKLDRSSAITRVGAFLRKTSLDELPQLINVLRGDMSLVGPRPCLEYETSEFKPEHFERFLVPAGVTGLWQVTARAHATFGEALDLDVTYARNWSLGLDAWLLLRTPLHVLRRRGTA